jgi:hypothetical protein
MEERIDSWDLVSWAGRLWRVCWRTGGVLHLSDGTMGRLVHQSMVRLVEKGNGFDLDREFKDPYPNE